MDTSQQTTPSQNETPAQVKKEPTINGKVSGLGFVVLAILMFILPQILIIALPSLFYTTDPIPHLMDGIIGFIALIVGLVIGLKVKKNAWLNGLFTGVLVIGFAQIAVVPSSRVGIGSILEYSLIIGLPVIVGSLIGGLINRSKTE